VIVGFFFGGAAYLTYYSLRDLYVGDLYSVCAAWARTLGVTIALSDVIADSSIQTCRRRCAIKAWLTFIGLVLLVGPGNPEILRAVHAVITRQSSPTLFEFVQEIQVALGLLGLPAAIALSVYAKCTRNVSDSQGKQRGSPLEAHQTGSPT
jgi:hypothetical protein